MDVTAKLAEFVTDLNYEAYRAKAVETAKIAVRDCLGVALAGSREEDARICGRNRAAGKRQGGNQRHWSGLQNLRVEWRALANGTAAHALDFDHSFTLMGQPTAPIVPATFALGETLGASGRRIIEAYVAGFEVTAKLVHSSARQRPRRLACAEHVGFLWRRRGVRQTARPDAAQMQMALVSRRRWRAASSPTSAP